MVEDDSGFYQARKYIRIGIESDEPGMTYYYCIYNIDEKGETTADNRLFDEITGLGNDILCRNCGEANSIWSNFCVSCGSTIKKAQTPHHNTGVLNV